MSLIWITLWIGLAVLTLGLLILASTRWGQSRPLRKCAVLSLLAHILLACFLTTVHIVTGAAGTVDDPAMHVTIEAEKAQVDTPAPQDAAPVPWEDTPQTFGVQPPDVPLERLEPITEEPEAPEFVADASRGDPLVDEADVPEPPPADRADQDLAAAVPEKSELEAPQPVEPPAAQRRDARITPFPIPALPPQSTNPNVQRDQWRPPDVARAEDLIAMEEQPTVDVTDGWSDDPLVPVNRRPRESADVSSEQSDRVPADDDSRPAGESASAPPPETDLKQKDDASRPGATRRLPAIYQNRFAPDRARIVESHGGSDATERAVDAALQWLAASQSRDGRWDSDELGGGQGRSVHGHRRRAAGVEADTGISGLALLAFLGAGYTHEEGPYADTVRKGLNFLLRSQDGDGSLGGQATLYARMYCHAMATFAISEAYAITRDARLEWAVRRAVQYSVSAQNPVSGGWRYQPGDLGDTSQLGWQIMALKSAETAGVEIPLSVREGIVRFLSSVAGGSQRGLAGYRPYSPPTRTMTAEALVCKLLMDVPRDARGEEEATRFLLEEPPGSDRPNFYYWYYGTLGMYCLQGPEWRAWNESLKTSLLQSQRRDGQAAGSWDPTTVWGGYGGRVYTTAMGALMLEVYYRYLPIYVEAARRARGVPMVR